MNSDYDYDYDDDEASSKFSNPFSDKNEVKSSNDLKTFNLKSKLNNFNTNNYNFEVHCLNNKKYYTWCGRSLISFSCQVCLLFVILCAIEFSKKK